MVLLLIQQILKQRKWRKILIRILFYGIIIGFVAHTVGACLVDGLSLVMLLGVMPTKVLSTLPGQRFWLTSFSLEKAP